MFQFDRCQIWRKNLQPWLLPLQSQEVGAHQIELWSFVSNQQRHHRNKYRHPWDQSRAIVNILHENGKKLLSLEQTTLSGIIPLLVISIFRLFFSRFILNSPHLVHQDCTCLVSLLLKPSGRLIYEHVWEYVFEV